ncbi:ankyrin repeat domain-containing protein [Thermoflavimicrobium dichotomicum]|uniref:Ankyrin repeat n=1 Tax=Thermoflavimicrobium dichotomicum TaxID=46223 RepID=A0A1I3TZU3_9BACL|nr:ankyrin repeat domain-containing protein [Thermoflavimicrobium dichotomicum]SFJ75047.1 Ankyrin repeat [Thermoflavimicrobium dichotomicum]
MVPKKRGILRMSKEGNLAELQVFLQSNPELVKTSFVNGNTLIHYAGNREIATLLIELGADLDCTNDFEETPLITAIWDERIDVVEFLLEQGVDVNHQDRDGNSALHVAAALGSEKLVQLLLSAGADVNLENEYEETPLFEAVKNGHISIISLLLKYGGTPNKLNHVLDAPLHISVEAYNEKAIECLLKHGTDPNILGDCKRTPLHIATEAGNKKIISLLLEHGAIPAISDSHGQLPQHVTESEEVFQFLFVQASANINPEISLPTFHERFEEYEQYYELYANAFLRPIYRLHPRYNEMVTPLPGGSLGKIVFAPEPKVSQSIWLGQNRFYDLAISPDGTKMAITASQIWDVEIRNYEDFSLIERLRLPEKHVHKQKLYCVAFSPDGEYLAIGPYLYHFASQTWVPACERFRLEPLQPSLCTVLPNAKQIFYSYCHSSHVNLVSYNWKNRSYLEQTIENSWTKKRTIVDFASSEDGNALAFFEATIGFQPLYCYVELYLPKENKIHWRIKIDKSTPNLPNSLIEQDFQRYYAGKVLIVDDTVVATLPYGNLVFCDRQTGEIQGFRTLNTNTILAIGKTDSSREIRIATDREIITMELPR